MKTLVTLFVCVLFSTSIHAQFPDPVIATAKERSEAYNLVKEYNKHLALDGDQLPLFLETVENSVVLSNKARKTYKGKEELKALTDIMIREVLEMEQILTQEQFELYRRLRQDIHPLKIVEAKPKTRD